MEKVWNKRFGKFGENFGGGSFKNQFEKLGEEIRWKNCAEKNVMEKLVEKLGEQLCGKIVWNNLVEKFIKLG